MYRMIKLFYTAVGLKMWISAASKPRGAPRAFTQPKFTFSSRLQYIRKTKYY